MTLRLVLSCDAERPPGSGEPCRGKLPLPTAAYANRTAATLAALDASWSLGADGDRCPACTRTDAPILRVGANW